MSRTLRLSKFRSQGGIMPESKQFARTSTCMFLNPLMPFSGIVSPPRKFLVRTKLVRLGRCCKTCNADDRLAKPFPVSER
uniref:Uncharacterized protein n=1 Tax=Arundo donax TaxID=35708 RepID=A0A0A9GRB6_ARUDO